MILSHKIFVIFFFFSLLGNIYLLFKNSSNRHYKRSILKELPNDKVIPSQNLSQTVTTLYRNSTIQNPQTYLLVMVLSAPANYEQRETIRNTWMNSYVDKEKKFTVKFVVGRYGLNIKDANLLSNEYSQHNDLVLLEDHLDSYNNLTRKVLQMFVWADKNINFSYMFKTDDDCFPRLDTIESELREHTSTQPLYWGSIGTDHVPLPDGKWKEDKWNLGEKYIPYAHGGGYVLSSALVHRIAINADGLVLYNNEDVSVGVWVCPFIQVRRHDDRFHPYSDCKEGKIIYHQYTSETLLETHKQFVTTGKLCPK